MANHNNTDFQTFYLTAGSGRPGPAGSTPSLNYSYSFEPTQNEQYLINTASSGSAYMYYDISTDIVTRIGNPGYIGTTWELRPYEEYDIVNIRYDLEPDDTFLPTLKLYRRRTLTNDTNESVLRTIEVSETFTSKSSFTDTEVIKIGSSVSASVNVKIPAFLTGAVDLNGSTTETEETTSTYSTTEEKTSSYTIRETVQATVPAHTTVTVDLVAMEYVAMVTYTIEVRGRQSGKSIFLKGKWQTTTVQEDDIQFKYPGGARISALTGETPPEYLIPDDENP